MAMNTNLTCNVTMYFWLNLNVIQNNIYFRYPEVDDSGTNAFRNPHEMSEDKIKYYSGLPIYSFWKLVETFTPKLSRKKLSVPSMALLYT